MSTVQSESKNTTLYNISNCYLFNAAAIFFISMILFMISGFILSPIDCPTYRGRGLYVLIQGILIPLVINYRYYDCEESLKYGFRYIFTSCFIFITNAVLYLRDIYTNDTCFSSDLSDYMFYCQLAVLIFALCEFALSIPNNKIALFSWYTIFLAYAPYVNIFVTVDIDRWFVDAWLTTLLVSGGVFLSWLSFHGVRVMLEYANVSEENSKFYCIPVFAELCTVITFYMYDFSAIKNLFLANCFRGVFLSSLIALASCYTIIKSISCKKKRKEEKIEMITTICSDAYAIPDISVPI
jgi:hypothetical protein